MKEKIKKVIKVGIVLGAVYLFGRVKGINDVVVKYKDHIDVDEVMIGLWTKNEKPGTVGRGVPKSSTEATEATDAE